MNLHMQLIRGYAALLLIAALAATAAWAPARSLPQRSLAQRVLAQQPVVLSEAGGTPAWVDLAARPVAPGACLAHDLPVPARWQSVQTATVFVHAARVARVFVTL